jgi:hypothetical protein
MGGILLYICMLVILLHSYKTKNSGKEFFIQNPKPKTQNAKRKTQNAKRKTTFFKVLNSISFSIR